MMIEYAYILASEVLFSSVNAFIVSFAQFFTTLSESRMIAIPQISDPPRVPSEKGNTTLSRVLSLEELKNESPSVRINSIYPRLMTNILIAIII